MVFRHGCTQLSGIKLLRRAFLILTQCGGETYRLTSDETARNDTNRSKNISVTTDAMTDFIREGTSRKLILTC
jgi:hypothetical protein